MITLFTHANGPNGWKVAIVLEELGLKYESKYLDFGTQEHKKPEYTKYNPNGRIPTIIDHDNNDFVLWESVAIIQYLVDRYDKENKLHYATGDEYYWTKQWLSFQVSGQGPYYGQAAWFNHLAPEKIPYAVTRYQNETARVLGVLDSVLAKQKYLVGDKVTIADLSFITWNKMLTWLLQGSEINPEKDFPNFWRWHQEITSRPSVVKVYQIKEDLNKK